MGRAGVVFGLSMLIKLVVVSFACLWPVRGRLWTLKHYRSLRHLYSLTDSNLDVFGLVWVHSAILIVLVANASSRRRRGFAGARVYPPYKRVRWERGSWGKEGRQGLRLGGMACGVDPWPVCCVACAGMAEAEGGAPV